MVFMLRARLKLILVFCAALFAVFAAAPAFAANGQLCAKNGGGTAKCISPFGGKNCWGSDPVSYGKSDCGTGTNCCGPAAKASGGFGSSCSIPAEQKANYDMASCLDSAACNAANGAPVGQCLQPGLVCCAVKKTVVEDSCQSYAGTCLAASNCYGEFMASVGQKNCVQGAVCCIEVTPEPKAEAQAKPEEKKDTKAPPSGVMTRLWLPPCISDGNCDLNAIVSTGVYFAQFLMGLSGALFFGIFVYGGTLYLVSFGNKSYVEKGKKAITGAAFGLVIVMGAWIFTSYLCTTITNGSPVCKGGPSATGGGAATKATPKGADSKCTSLGAGWSCVTFDGANLKAVQTKATSQGYETKGGLCPGDFHVFCAKLKK